jgi:Ner family transcriptional regulator
MSKKGWHSEDIKAAIRKHGITLESLSEDNGLNKRACSLALIRPFWAAEMVIAEFLGVSPRQIWPQRYDPDGAYRHPKSQNHHTRRAASRNAQEGKAA